MGAWAIEQVTVGAIDHSFVHSRREVKSGVVPKAPETVGYQTLDGWPRTDGGWGDQEQQVLQGAQDLFTGRRRRPRHQEVRRSRKGSEYESMMLQRRAEAPPIDRKRARY
jgi:hypothetical protein